MLVELCVNEKDNKHTHISLLTEWDDNLVYVCRALSLGEGSSPKSSVPSVHIDRLKSRNDLPIRSRSSLPSSSLNKEENIYIYILIIITTWWGMAYVDEGRKIICFGSEVAKFDILLLSIDHPRWKLIHT